MENKRKRIVDILKICGVQDKGILASAFIHNIFTEQSRCERDARTAARVGQFVLKNRRAHDIFQGIVQDLKEIDWISDSQIERARPETLLVKLAACIEMVLMLPGSKNLNECVTTFDASITLRNNVLKALENCYQYQEEIVRLCDMLDFHLGATKEILESHFS